jgi:lipoprotein-anchoring transpeptidase ErfK/SrfK
MSKRIVVAITATIGVTLLLANVAQARPELVGVHNGEYAPGTIVVKTNERHLYLILDQDHAMRYPVGVGKFGKQWAGETALTASIAIRPGRLRRKSSTTSRTCRT